MPLLPVALYRQIVNAQGMNTTNTGDLVQVSPLISTIAWRAEGSKTAIIDPYIAPLQNTLSGYGRVAAFYLADTHPVIAGHTYRYFLVRFGEDHEIDQVIDAGSVTISAQ